MTDTNNDISRPHSGLQKLWAIIVKEIKEWYKDFVEYAKSVEL